MRATISVTAPGGKGLINWIGLVGYSAASDNALGHKNIAATKTILVYSFTIILSVVSIRPIAVRSLLTESPT
jgi:hypothetical protein